MRLYIYIYKLITNYHNFQIWLLVVKLDMALVIKALLASECVAKIYICMIVMPIKLIFFLYGWQPEVFIHLALWLHENHLLHDNQLETLKIEQNIHSLVTNSNNTPLSRGVHFYNQMNSNLSLSLIDTFGQKEDDENKSGNHSAVAEGVNKFSYEVMAVCSLANSLDFFGNYSLATFNMLTTIIRYVCVNLE